MTEAVNAFRAIKLGFPQALIIIWRNDAGPDQFRIVEHIRLENPIAAPQVGQI